MLVSVIRGFFSDDWDIVEDRMVLDVDELLIVVLVFEVGVDVVFFFVVIVVFYNI